MSMTISDLSTFIHDAHKNWWKDPETGNPKTRNKGEAIALMHSELSEGFHGVCLGLDDDHLTNHSMEEVEIADIVIRLVDYMEGHRLLTEDNHYSLADRVQQELFGEEPRKAELTVESMERAIVVRQRTIKFLTTNGLITSRTKFLCMLHYYLSQSLEGMRKSRVKDECNYMARTFISCFQYFNTMCDGSDSLEEIIMEKVEYNKKRSEHKLENRAAKGGKLF